ncbi:MAG: ribonuclease HII [Chloroflexi bacterium]|nr:ribonuclease HII [Chloroflexota bacterium]
MTRPKPDLLYERALWEGGFRHVAGLDEAGRGALAGPVAAAAVILPPDLPPHALEGVQDSKQMRASQREFWAERIRQVAVAWAVGYATPAEIDAWGIVPAVHLAMRRALDALLPAPDFLLIDYLRLPDCPLPQTALVKGDQRVLSIAAASVLAKTHRDALMRTLDARYPRYGFARHKGYGTRQHREALARWGASPIHRRSFHVKAHQP